MQAQLAVVVAVCNHNQTPAPTYSPLATSSSVPATKAQDTERWSSFKETPSQKVVKNSHTDDIVQALTKNGTLVEAIDTKTDTSMYHTAFTSHPDIVSLMPSRRLFMQDAMFFIFCHMYSPCSPLFVP